MAPNQGPQQDVVREIVVAGNEEVADKFIKRRLILEEGDVLVSDKTDRSRTRLYDTGAFALVDLETERLEGASSEEQNGLRLTARIREVSPYRVRYGGFTKFLDGMRTAVTATAASFSCCVWALFISESQ